MNSFEKKVNEVLNAFFDANIDDPRFNNTRYCFRTQV